MQPIISLALLVPLALGRTLDGLPSSRARDRSYLERTRGVRGGASSTSLNELVDRLRSTTSWLSQADREDSTIGELIERRAKAARKRLEGALEDVVGILAAHALERQFAAKGCC